MFEKLKSWLPIIGAFIVPVVGVYAWWGGFNAATIVEAERGPYVYAYLDHNGDFAKLPKTQNLVQAAMKEQGLRPGMPINVLIDDPRKVARVKLRAQAGFLVDAQAVIKPPLKRGEMPKRPVWVAKVHAAVLLAPGKAYQGLYDYLRTRDRDLQMPMVELYDSPPEPWRIGEFSVEMAR